MLDNELAATPETEVTTPEVEVKETDTPSGEKEGDSTVEKTEAEKKPEYTDEEREQYSKRVQRRIDHLTALKVQAEKNAAEALAELSKYKPKQVDDAPKESDFNSYEDYLIAKGKHEALKEVEAKQNEAKKVESEAARQKAIDAKRQEFLAKEAEFRKDVPDYDKAVEVLNEYVGMVNPESQGFQVFRDLMLSSPDMPALSYHLGKNPDVLEEMLSMEPAQIAWKLISEAVRLKDKETQQPRSLPTPIKPVQGKGRVEKRPENMSADELVKWMKVKA